MDNRWYVIELMKDRQSAGVYGVGFAAEVEANDISKIEVDYDKDLKEVRKVVEYN